MMRTSSFEKIMPYFPAPIASVLRAIPKEKAQQIQEIRLRLGRGIQIVCSGQASALQSGGYVTRALLDDVFLRICEHSVHSCCEELRQGYVTIAGGCRVGLCGTAVMHEGVTEMVRDISGMNFRIAGEVKGCAAELVGKVLGNGLCGVLIAGPPNSGKTTILRDICRILGSRYRISVIDERGEIAALHQGISPFELGEQTDVFDGYPKAEGIELAVRVMSPQILICDEIGGNAEVDALLPALHTGVHLIAAAHAESLPALYERPQIRRLLDANAFSYAAMLGTGEHCGKVESLRCVGREA